MGFMRFFQPFPEQENTKKPHKNYVAFFIKTCISN